MKKLFMLLAAALMLGVAMPTMAQQKKAPAKRTTTASKGKTSGTTTINYTARGELGLFDLRGPVKECVWSDGDQPRKLGFDRKGMWISENGRNPWDNYGNVKRDSKGRIIQMGDDVESGELFTYNANGLMIKHVTIYMDGRDIATYSYNSKGECTKETFSYGDMYGSGKSTAIFTILTRDSQGNWTKRKTQKGGIETRTITYYAEGSPSSEGNPLLQSLHNRPEQPQPPQEVTPKTIKGIDIIPFAYELVKMSDYEKAKQELQGFPEPVTDGDAITVKYDGNHWLKLDQNPTESLVIMVTLDVSQYDYSQINYELVKLGFEFSNVQTFENNKSYFYNKEKHLALVGITTGDKASITLSFAR